MKDTAVMARGYEGPTGYLLTGGLRPMAAGLGPVSREGMRRSNALCILNLLRQKGRSSRTDLAHDAGLTIPTAHRVIADLEKLGLVRTEPAPMVTAGSGRRPIWYAFNQAAAVIAGVDIGNETSRVGLALADGTVACTRRWRTAELADHLDEAIAEMISALAATLDPDHGPLVGVGVGVAAAVEPATGVIKRASMFGNWNGVPLRALLQERLGCAVSVEQDDHLSALAEIGRNGAARGAESAVVLNVGKGIGVGLMIEGRMVRGAQGLAGRVAHWPVDPRGADRRTLADILVADALVRLYREKGGVENITDGHDLCATARHGDPIALQVIEEAGTLLGDVFARLAATFDPAMMILGGGLAHSFDLFAPAIERALSATTLSQIPCVVASPLGHDAVVLGGLISARDHLNTWLEEQLERAYAQGE